MVVNQQGGVRETGEDGGRGDEAARLREEVAALRKDVDALASQLRETEGSFGWLLAQKTRQLADALAPRGTRRRALLADVLASLRPFVKDGLRTTLRTRVADRRENLRLAVARSRAEPRTPGGLASVLFVSGSFGAMERYRCSNTREQLSLVGVRSTLLRGAEARFVREANRHDVVVLHRVPFTTAVAEIVAAARQRGAPVLFDIDDLVFDASLCDRIDALGWMEAAEAALFRQSFEAYRQTLAACDGAIVPTEPLAEAVRALGVPAVLHRNAPGLELLGLSREARRRRRPDPGRIVLGYASGSRTHNRDFAEASSALLRLFARIPSLELHVIGYLDLDAGWEPFRSRVKTLEFVPWQRLPALLATFDVNLAPLEHGNPFCEAKSELKWAEAAAVCVPTVASPTVPFRGAIRHGETGFLASTTEEWVDALRVLASDPERRRIVGEAAAARLEADYDPGKLGKSLVKNLSDLKAG